MENISLKAICLGVLSYLLPFIIMAIYLFIKLADVFFSGVSGRERVDLDFLNNEYLLVAFIIIPIISGYISMRISNKESYVNPAIVGVIIIGFNLCDINHGYQISFIAVVGNDDTGLGVRPLPAVV